MVLKANGERSVAFCSFYPLVVGAHCSNTELAVELVRFQQIGSVLLNGLSTSWSVVDLGVLFWMDETREVLTTTSNTAYRFSIDSWFRRTKLNTVRLLISALHSATLTTWTLFGSFRNSVRISDLRFDCSSWIWRRFLTASTASVSGMLYAGGAFWRD